MNFQHIDRFRDAHCDHPKDDSSWQVPPKTWVPFNKQSLQIQATNEFTPNTPKKSPALFQGIMKSTCFFYSAGANLKGGNDVALAP